MRTDLAAGHSHLGPPRVVGEGIVYPPVQGYLFPISDVQTRIRKGVKSDLRPPTVVTPAVAFVQLPLSINLAPRDAVMRRNNQRAVQWRLFPPAVIDLRPQTRYLSVNSTYSLRGAPKSRLQPPAVVAVQALAAPVATSLAYSVRGRTIAGVRPPRFIGAAIVFAPVKVTLARNKPQPTTTRLAPPAVAATQFFAAPVQTTLAYSRRGKPRSVLGRPTDTVGLEDQGRVKTTLVAAPRQGRAAHGFVGRPVVVFDNVRFFGPAAHLAYSRRGTPKSRLSTPVVVSAGAVFTGPRVTLVADRTAVEQILHRTIAGVRAPRFIGAAITFRPVQVHLAYSSRGAPKSRLGLPASAPVVAQVYYGPRVTLVKQFRTSARSFLRPPVIPPLARPVDVTLARVRPVAVTSRLRQPTVIDLTPQTRFLSVTLTYSRRGTPRPRLFPPAVISSDTFFGPTVNLAYSRRGRARAGLAAPAVVFIAEPVLYPVQVTLAYSVRGRPLSRLGRPSVVGAVVYLGPAVNLAYSRRGAPESVLRKPTVIDVRPQTVYLTTWLAYSRRGVTKPVLRKPSVIDVRVYVGPAVTLAYSVRGTPRPELRPPVVIDVRPQTVYLTVSLAYSRRGVPKSRLAAPAAVRYDAFYGPTVSLAYSVRGRTIAGVRPPRFVGAGIVFAPVQVHLVRIRPQPTHPRLSPPPTIQATPKAERDLRVNLTYSKRGTPKSRLEPPSVVGTPTPVLYPIQTTLVRLSLRGRGALSDLPVVVYAPVAEMGGVLVSLAPQRRGQPKSLLRPAAVVAVAVYYGPQVTLTYGRRGAPRSVLHAPIIPPLAEPTRITLAYSRRGVSRYVLRKPTVIDLRPQTYYLSVTLARNKPQPVTSFLRPSAVTEGLPRAERDLRVYLTYSVRGRPKSVLRKPVVIDLRPQNYYLAVALAYSRRGQAKSRLTFVAGLRVVYFGPAVTLAYSLRGEPKSRLTPPTVVRYFAAQPVRVELAYSRRGRPVYKLKAPTIVGPVLARPVRVTLTRITHPPVSWLLRPPTVVTVRENRPTRVTLAQIIPAPTVSVLRPPTVVFRPAVVTTLQVHVAYSRRGKARYGLAAPAVIGAGIAFFGPQVTLARITPPPTMAVLHPPAVVNTFHPPGGDVCGFDIAGSFVCDETSTDSNVTGSDEQGSVVEGSDRPESRISGETDTVDEVCGTDEQAL